MSIAKDVYLSIVIDYKLDVTNNAQQSTEYLVAVGYGRAKFVAVDVHAIGRSLKFFTLAVPKANP